MQEATAKPDVAIVPLAMPLLARPGSIATVMVLTAQAQKTWQLLLLALSIVVTAAASYLMLRAASLVNRFLGQSGRAILERVMGLLLVAIAVQFMIGGVREAFPDLHRSLVKTSQRRLRPAADVVHRPQMSDSSPSIPQMGSLDGTMAPATAAGWLAEHRVALTGHCYRMLGSVAEADDAVQETLLRAWRSLAGFDGRASIRTWLYRIATNVCLDALAERKRRQRPVLCREVGTIDETLTALPGSAWIEPIPDAAAIPTDVDPAQQLALRQTIRLAFVAALQHLPPRQRAVLLSPMCWIFGGRDCRQLGDVAFRRKQRAAASPRHHGQPRHLPSQPPRRCPPATRPWSVATCRPSSATTWTR